MELEKQVCSLELSKKLKELGVTQKSQFYWVNTGLEIELCNREDYGYYHEVDKYQTAHNINTKEEYSAFTVAELGKMLPLHLIYPAEISNNTMEKETQMLYTMLKKDTEADARAKMLIFLIENKRIKAGDLK